jgi:NAD(P)-dependent dehydrogenase (short-subunit alcohol dehydrogenase family)
MIDRNKADVSGMSRLDEKVILITGATDGLGKQVARNPPALGATILIHGRSQAKGDATLREIRDVTGGQKLVYYNADLSSLDAVRLLVDEIQARHVRLDVLIK